LIERRTFGRGGEDGISNAADWGYGKKIEIFTGPPAFAFK
jgi:hypothetical protein